MIFNHTKKENMIMKKDYISPQVLVMLFESEQILAGSGEIQSKGTDQAVVTPDNKEYKGNEWASRQSVWADEEEEE